MAQTASEPGWLTGLDFAITDAPAAGGGAAGGGAAGGGGAGGGGAMPNSGEGGGRFSLSREEAQSMLTVAKRVRDQLQDMTAKAVVLTQLTPPADDPASASYNNLMVGAGQGTGAFSEGSSQVERERAYASELVTRLEKALGITESTDEQAASDVKTAGAGNQDKGFA
ncbi:hypothetical protein AB0K15_01500 [Amycolatopsis sp. NPDC049253]|uniref:hypothetical protein n=1 Tax=Amycolatopsis sp. NPDC049253 TaxID=3155274 RepID=UPI003440C529